MSFAYCWQVRVESLYEDLDFYHLMDRDTFHEISKDLFERVTPVVARALENANLSPDDINAYVLVGGGSRIPKIQVLLSVFLSALH
jgi:molecular chaperone DnaK (HSP70)